LIKKSTYSDGIQTTHYPTPVVNKQIASKHH